MDRGFENMAQFHHMWEIQKSMQKGIVKKGGAVSSFEMS